MKRGATFRWVGRFLGLVIWFVLVVPVGVIVATKIGMQPTHWSGVKLSEFSLPLLTSHPDAAPEPGKILLSRSQDQDDSDTGNLAPSYWDADAQQVVLGATTDAGAAVRKSLGDASGTPYRVERFTHSSKELQGILDELNPPASYGMLQAGIDAEHNRVELGVVRLSHALFTDLAARYGDAMEVRLAPFQQRGSTLSLILPDGGAAPKPTAAAETWSSRADPLQTWWVLTTGFPWFMGAALIFAIVVWVLVRVRRLDGELAPSPHRMPAPAPPAPAPAPAPAQLPVNGEVS